MGKRKHPQLPDRREYYPVTVKSLKGRGGSATIEELEEDVANALKLSESARAIPHGDGRRSQFQYDLAWVRTYLKWAGAVENSERGVWHLTPLGASLSDSELRGIWKKIVDLHRKKRKAADQRRDDEADAELDLEVPDEKPPELGWKERLLAILLSIDPSAFERVCQRLLRESGFTTVEVVGRSGDGGIDGIGVLRVNLLSFRVFFQSKRWKGSVRSNEARDFRGAMTGRADKGLIITTGTFTGDARKEASRDGAPPIDLIDGDTLCDLLKASKIGVSVSLVESVSVDETVIRAI